MIQIEKFIGHDKARVLRTVGLNKIAAVMEKNASGLELEEIDLPTAVALIGAKSFTKRAELQQINNGLFALENLTRKS